MDAGTLAMIAAGWMPALWAPPVAWEAQWSWWVGVPDAAALRQAAGVMPD